MNNVINSESFLKAIKGASVNLENNKQVVNNLNVFPVPDGDTGTNMSLTISFAVKELMASPYKSVGELAGVCSNGALMGARGNSGVILSQLFRGFSKALIGKNDANIAELADAFKGASDMAYRAVMKPTEGTILTVAREMAEFAVENKDKYNDVNLFLKSVINAGEISLNKTPELLPVLAEAGVVDAGGKGLICILEGALMALEGKDMDIDEQKVASQNNITTNIEGDITFSYCTEFLIRAKNDNKDYKNYLKNKLAPIGDCLLVVGDESLIKVHVHTNEPWDAMKFASKCGTLCKIKIENMNEQHSEAFVNNTDANDDGKEKYDKTHKDYIFIGVAAGGGIVKILKDLGITYVIEGGQTMNPSTQDFMEIINETDADNYILFPNNKNIILAASQAKELSDKNICVIPTKNIPESINAMMAFSPSSNMEENFENMNEAITEVVSGQITFAVRDSKVKNRKIKKGEYLGISMGEIVANKKDLDETMLGLIKEMTKENDELVSLYYGEDVKEEDAQKLSEKLEKEFPDTDFEVHYGGQPLYYYIVSAE